jgi:Mrp family chromosome partitioning ATPase
MRPLSESFDVLRMRVEARAALPALVLISAAQRGDGTTSVACGLARAFAADGRRTLLIDANLARAAVADELEVEPLPLITETASDLGARNGEVPRLSLVAIPPETVRDLELPRLLRTARANFAVTIIDAGPLPACSTALELARCADAIVLAVRLGRRSSDDDREAAELAGERLLGVVPTRAQGPRKPFLESRRDSAASGLRATLRNTSVVR